jgi:hypothetical protein
MSATVFPLPAQIWRAAEGVTTRVPVRLLVLFVALTLVGLLAGLQASLPQTSDGLTVRDYAGQLVIAWPPLKLTPGQLEIIDGMWSTTIPIYARLSGVTYARRTGDVQVRLIAGQYQHVTHFVSRDDATPAQLGQQFRSLAAQARSVRIASEKRRIRINQMQVIANRMLTLTSAAR